MKFVTTGSLRGRQERNKGTINNILAFQDGDGTLAQPGIISALTDPSVGPSPHGRVVDTTVAAALTRCLDRAGVCRARPTRRTAGYKIDERLGDGPLYQDFRAIHPTLSVTRRVRLYPFPHGASEELRTMIRRAAEREFRALESSGCVPIVGPYMLCSQYGSVNEFSATWRGALP